MTKPMFARVLRHSDSKGAARLVLLSIADHAKPDGTGSYPRLSTIAHESGMSVRSVQRQLPKLVRSGELLMTPRAGDTYLFTVRLRERTGDSGAKNSGKKRERVTALSSRGDSAVGPAVTALSQKPSTEPHRNTSSETGGLPVGFREVVDRIRALRGNSARGRHKRYACRLTRPEVIQVVRWALSDREPSLVLEALTKFADGDGFTRSARPAQRMSLFSWIQKEKPPLMKDVERRLASLPAPDAAALVREVRGDRDSLDYITGDDLRELARRLQVLA